MMKSEHETFAENFKDCCSRSCYRLAHEASEQDGPFLAALEECSELYQQIEQKLGKDQALIDRFDAAKNFWSALSGDYVYRQGFQDCVYLLRWINLI